MPKSSLNEIKLELILLLIVLITGIIQILFKFRVDIEFIITWIGSVLLVYTIWRLIQKWARKNLDKLPGKLFEFLFFFFLFLSTYALTFIVSFTDRSEMI